MLFLCDISSSIPLQFVRQLNSCHLISPKCKRGYFRNANISKCSIAEAPEFHITVVSTSAAPLPVLMMTIPGDSETKGANIHRRHLSLFGSVVAVKRGLCDEFHSPSSAVEMDEEEDSSCTSSFLLFVSSLPLSAHGMHEVADNNSINVVANTINMDLPSHAPRPHSSDCFLASSYLTFNDAFLIFSSASSSSPSSYAAPPRRIAS